MNDSVTIVVPKLNQGGTAKASLGHAESIKLFGISVEILVCKGKLPKSKASAFTDDIRYSHLGLGSFFNLPSLIYLAFKYRKKLNGTLIAMHFDSMIFCLLVKLFGGNFRLYGHFHTDLEGYTHSLSKLKNLLFKLFLNLLRCYDGLVFLTNEQKNWFQAKKYINPNRTKLFVIPNPVLNVEKKHSCALNKDRLLYAGRLSEEKNVAFILDSYKRYIDQGGDLPLDICGDGPLLDELKDKACLLNISDRVNFRGYILELSTYLARAKVLILASHVEGFPLVLLEGINYNTNIITSNCSSSCFEMFNIDRESNDDDFLGSHFSIVNIKKNNSEDRFSSQLYRLSKQESISDEEAISLLRKYSKEAIGDEWRKILK
ncbi:glycosyltransferase [Vibrio vulnificus]|uniref:glycosyltransferase n=1 Tax=Vibrio vulnificus TaxID=672 RepID=UPI0028785C12|nr:glycosyltransferase [Vibrio vulnificus]EIE1226040.1 glycosyltransferase [Vibrio vulnificus]MDS1832134.1 glycosyltransferase [Vibrio vulnificus]